MIYDFFFYVGNSPSSNKDNFQVRPDAPPVLEFLRVLAAPVPGIIGNAELTESCIGLMRPALSRVCVDVKIFLRADFSPARSRPLGWVISHFESGRVHAVGSIFDSVEAVGESSAVRCIEVGPPVSDQRVALMIISDHQFALFCKARVKMIDVDHP